MPISLTTPDTWVRPPGRRLSAPLGAVDDVGVVWAPVDGVGPGLEAALGEAAFVVELSLATEIAPVSAVGEREGLPPASSMTSTAATAIAMAPVSAAHHRPRRLEDAAASGAASEVGE